MSGVTEVSAKFVPNSRENDLPNGYKHTLLGLIPIEWNCESLGDLCSLKSGLGITSKSINETGEYPCYGGNGLRGYTSQFTHEGDYALIGRQGALCGNIQYLTGKFFASEHALVASPFDRVDPKWLAIYLESMNLNQYSESSAQPGLSAEKLRVLNLITPTFAEQTAIANALSDVDALIQELEKLIAKKQAIKTATMQQLLTGRTRLPQFANHPDGRKKGYKPSELGEIPEDWEIEPLGKSHTLATGTTPPTSNLKNYGGRYLFVSPADLSDSKYIIKTEKHLSDDGFHLARIFPSGSTLFTCIGSTIGKTGLAREELTSNQQINAIFPNDESDHEFIYYAITYIAPRIKALAGQQAVPLVNKSEFGETVFCFPNCKNEQTAIATILSDMDEEIQAMAQRLNKTRQIKQGMMQELLTGKTRLIKPESRA